MSCDKSFWLWYPGDFERCHALKQNFSRVERGVGWPAFWKSEGYRQRVVFRRRKPSFRRRKLQKCVSITQPL